MPRAKVPIASSAISATNNAFLNTLLCFVQWSQGRKDVQSTLLELSQYVGADAVSLSRWEKSKDSVRLAGLADTMNDPLTPRLSRSFARTIFGEYIGSIKPGSAVLMSELLDNKEVSDPDLERWMFKRDVVDIACICLNSENGTRDILEFHFSRSVPKLWHAESQTIGGMLHDVFQGRQRGMMMQLLLRNAAVHRKAQSLTSDHGVLSPENPAGLTRTEWRVCALIANGLSRDGVAREMAIKSDTLRTHLRNIYAKTGYERFHELALRLVSPVEQASLTTIDQSKAA